MFKLLKEFFKTEAVKDREWMAGHFEVHPKEWIVPNPYYTEDVLQIKTNNELLIEADKMIERNRMEKLADVVRAMECSCSGKGNQSNWHKNNNDGSVARVFEGWPKMSYKEYPLNDAVDVDTTYYMCDIASMNEEAEALGLFRNHLPYDNTEQINLKRRGDTKYMVETIEGVWVVTDLEEIISTNDLTKKEEA